MKKLLNAVLCVVMTILIVGIASTTIQNILKFRDPTDVGENSSSGSEELPEGVYRIHYKLAGTEDDLFPAYEWMKKSDGVYPETYDTAEGASVSALAAKETSVEWSIPSDWSGEANELPPVPIKITPIIYDPNDSDHWAWFIGWYLDPDCAEEFSGEIAAGTEGDVTIYAKIGEDRESNWTKFY